MHSPDANTAAQIYARAEGQAMYCHSSARVHESNAEAIIARICFANGCDGREYDANDEYVGRCIDCLRIFGSIGELQQYERAVLESRRLRKLQSVARRKADRAHRVMDYMAMPALALV